MRTSNKGFSVIVASHGRIELLANLLSSLNRSRSVIDENIEVLVIDSTPVNHSEEVCDTCKRFGAILIEGPLNVRRKRNIGAQSATREWLFFVDSDCEVSLHIFEAYRRVFLSDKEIRAAAGPTVFRGDETSFTKLIRKSALLDPFRRPNNSTHLLWSTTSNLCIRRDVFESIGGFREDFPFRLGGDDTDLCLRLRDLGHVIISVPEALCYHSWATWSRPSLVVRRSFRWGWMHSRLMRDHPRYRRFDAPGLPVHMLAVIAIGIIGSITGDVKIILIPVLFFGLAILLHALFASLYTPQKWLAFIEDLALALVELPFGFGRALGSLANGSLLGILYRLDADDVAMDSMFPETVRSLWSDHLALLCSSFIIWWII